jgi:hypothetical protein
MGMFRFKPSIQFIERYDGIVPVTIAVRSKAWTVFALPDAGIVGSNPT